MGFKDLFAPKISNSNMEHVKKLLKQSSECAALSNTTLRPDVFFDKYAELERCLEKLIQYEKYRIFKGTTPSVNLRNVRDNRKNDLNAFIQRSYAKARKLAEKADTDGKKNDIFKEYFAEMEKYSDAVDGFNKQVLSDLRELSVNDKI